MFRSSLMLIGALVMAAGCVQAADNLPDPSPDEVQKIIKTFIDKESQLAKVREEYTYRQNVKMTEVDPAGGSYEVVEDVTFDDRDRRIDHVTYAPVVSLQNIVMTPEDQEDLEAVMPFTITLDTASNYDVTYVAHQKVDELTCYVFTLKPKELTKDRKRYFEGQVWVDDQDLEIVKTYGKSTGHLRKNEDQQFPKFETYRQLVDGKYWFPVYTYADDTLRFKDGPSQRIKIVIKYDNYKRYQFKTKSTITFGDTVPDASAPKK